MKKLISLLFLAALFLAGCVQTPLDEPSDIPTLIPGAEMTIGRVTFEEAVQASDCAVIAEFVSYPGIAEYVFNVKEVLRGEAPETPFTVISAFANSNLGILGTDRFTVGKKYILLLRRYDSLFYDSPEYSFMGPDIYIPVDDIGSGRIYGRFITDTFDGDVITYIREAEPRERDEWHTTSKDMAEIIDFSDFVLEVKIGRLVVEGRNSNTYSVDEFNVIKRSKPLYTDNGSIVLSLFKDIVKTGENYIVMVSSTGPLSIQYLQSSKRSVISMEDTEAVEEVRRIIGELET
jgi:hypothetical protein